MNPLCSPSFQAHAREETDAFHVLVQSHASMVFATARRITGDAALAEDVAQETFLELSRKGPLAEDSTAAWLHRVAWRKACNAVRGESRRRKHERAAAAETPSVVEDASWHDLEPLIDEAMEELPTQQRALLVEHYLQGRSQQEMAACSGLSQSTISRQLDAGLHELRSLLRAKGWASGAGLTALLAARSVDAAPASLQTSLGKLALSAGGAGTSTVPVATTILFTMTATKLAVSAVAVATLIGIPFMLVDKQETTPPHAKPAALPPSALPAAAASSSGIERPRYHAPPVPENVRFKIEAFIRRHKGMSKEELMRDPELEQLSAAFFAAGQLDSPEMKKKIDEAMTTLSEAKGIKHGAINMDFGEFDSPEFRTWAAAALSNDKDQVQDWVIRRLQGAAFEFAVAPNTEKSADGVSVHPDSSLPDAKEDKKKF